MSAIYEAKDILNILPHRHPFLLVDRIIECNGTDWIVGIKNITVSEPCFEGHFPGEPVFPGVLQLEALAQTAGILLNQQLGRNGQVAYFLGVDKARFRRRVVPGDQLRLEIRFLKLRLGTARVAGRALVESEIACEAEMLFGGSGK